MSSKFKLRGLVIIIVQLIFFSDVQANLKQCSFRTTTDIFSIEENMKYLKNKAKGAFYTHYVNELNNRTLENLFVKKFFNNGEGARVILPLQNESIISNFETFFLEDIASEGSYNHYFTEKGLKKSLKIVSPIFLTEANIVTVNMGEKDYLSPDSVFPAGYQHNFSLNNVLSKKEMKLFSMFSSRDHSGCLILVHSHFRFGVNELSSIRAYDELMLSTNQILVLLVDQALESVEFLDVPKKSIVKLASL